MFRQWMIGRNWEAEMVIGGLAQQLCMKRPGGHKGLQRKAKEVVM